MSDSIFRPYFEEQGQKAASFFATEHVDDYVGDMVTNNLNLIHEAFADIDTLIKYEDLVASAEQLTNVDLSLIAMSINNIEAKYKNLMNLNVVITESHSDSDRIRLTQEALSGGGMALIAGVIAAIIAFIAWIFGKKNDTNTSAGETAKKNIQESEEHAKEIQRLIAQMDANQVRHSADLKKEREFSKEKEDRDLENYKKDTQELQDRIDKLSKERSELFRKVSDLGVDNVNMASTIHDNKKELSSKNSEIAFLESKLKALEHKYNKFRKEVNSAPIFTDFKTKNTFALAFAPIKFKSDEINSNDELVAMAEIAREVSVCTFDFIRPIVNASSVTARNYLEHLAGPNAISFKSITTIESLPNKLSGIPDSDVKKGFNISINESLVELSTHRNNIVPLQNIIKHDFDIVFGREFFPIESSFPIGKGPDGPNSVQFMPVIDFKPTKESPLKYKEISVEGLNVENIIKMNERCKTWVDDKNACGFWTFDGSNLSGAIGLLKKTLDRLEAGEKEFKTKGTFGKLNESDSKYNHRILVALISAVNKNLHAVVSINDVLIRHALGGTLFAKQLLGQFKERK